MMFLRCVQATCHQGWQRVSTHALQPALHAHDRVRRRQGRPPPARVADDRGKRSDRRRRRIAHHLLSFGVTLNVRNFEIYYVDWLTAYDPNYPAYAQYHPAYTQAIEATATALK